MQHEAWLDAEGGGRGEEEEEGGVGRPWDQTIFLMLGLLKLPALRCFWT